MIVVFVVDTSPSMGKPLGKYSEEPKASSMSRLDLSKMAVEEIVRRLKKRIHEHNSHMQQLPPRLQESFRTVGLGFAPRDEYLLLSTAPQHTGSSVVSGGAGGRLLVGFAADHYYATAGSHPGAEGSAHGASNHNTNSPMDHTPVVVSPFPQQHGVDSFQRELKKLRAHESSSSSSHRPKFPDDGGGANGLNAALSAGLQMMSRYRLKFKATENFGMGRLPSTAILNPTMGGASTHALQPACLIVVTDGNCLRAEGGGALKLNASTLLREFYQEPFRWDQRIFCLGVGGSNESITSTQFLHPHLRALCEVTGGSHMMLRSPSSSSSGSISSISELLVNLLAPPLPKHFPLPDPISLLPSAQQNAWKRLEGISFVNGGPIVTFQALEPDNAGIKYRAGIHYVPILHGDGSPLREPSAVQPPVWCIPETFFPSKKLDTLPPRSAQPCLMFSRYPARLGSKCFEPSSVMKILARLDQLVLANLKIVVTANQQSRFLKRDVYICEWISVEGRGAEGPLHPPNIEFCPVLVAGAGRPTLSDGDGNYLSIGILHTPQRSQHRLATLTLLPPEPHILLPLLVRAAEAEHRALKKALSMNESGSKDSISQKQAAAASRSVHLDENWRNELRAYLFRVPPYYQNALKRTLRSVLPFSAHPLLSTDSNEGSLASQCFSKLCLQKIRNAEQMAKNTNERLERQEAELRRRGMPEAPSRTDAHQQAPSRGLHATEAPKTPTTTIKYGQYDPRCPVDSYLAALRHMPAPWRLPSTAIPNKNDEERFAWKNEGDLPSVMEALGDLPANCLMAYYESRRRWIFGGSGVSIRGVHVEGVKNDGSNVQRCGAKRDKLKESLLSFAGVGVSELNATTTSKMGDYRERLLWSRAPVVGYGANDSTGVSATTSQNGAPVWSVDNDAMPIAFFDEKTGDFVDSVQARIRSRLFVNFGNPYKDKRADSLIPEQYLNQRPRKGIEEDDARGPLTPPTSPPHDTYSASEGEGEAVFAGKPISRSSPRKSPLRIEETEDTTTPTKKQKSSAETPSGPPIPVDGENKRLHRGSSRGIPDRHKEEKQTPPQPPPPPRRRASAVTPPPPPPKAPPLRKPPPPPPPPSASGAPTFKKPPPPPTQGTPPSTTKPAPPSKTPAPPPPSKPLHNTVKRPSVVQDANVDLQTPDVKPNVNLPPGWMSVWSKSQKRWYFFNTKNNKSVWQWPPP